MKGYISDDGRLFVYVNGRYSPMDCKLAGVAVNLESMGSLYYHCSTACMLLRMYCPSPGCGCQVIEICQSKSPYIFSEFTDKRKTETCGKSDQEPSAGSIIYPRGGLTEEGSLWVIKQIGGQEYRAIMTDCNINNGDFDCLCPQEKGDCRSAIFENRRYGKLFVVREFD